ncbi:Membrane-anchored protein [Deinococcus saxicola]|uniref:COG4705 family protein n=1 Tax=Deinococcus saxicola TaxID=249406 RepID=UPI0039F04359
MTAVATPQDSTLRTLISKVPEVTAFFWIIKVLATTVGETAADYLNTNLNLGLTGTSLIMAALLIAVLIAQFRLKKYVPGVYWLAIVLISVVGTLITDNLTDNFGVSLWTSSAMFSAALAATFTAWYLRERTLSIHSIFTARREAFYWLAVLFTFALGTATGDLLAEKLQLGYLNSVLLFAGVITLAALAHVYLKLGSILTFWIVYILTRPLGASIGDFLSQAKTDGGLGLGTTVTSFIFLAAILAVVSYLAVTRRDQVALSSANAA